MNTESTPYQPEQDEPVAAQPYKDDTSDGTTAAKARDDVAPDEVDAAAEPTDDSVPDGTQLPTATDDQVQDEEGDPHEGEDA